MAPHDCSRFTRIKWRFCSDVVAATAAILAPVVARATLVFVIPARDGVLIAADSRLTVKNRYIDGVEKIRLVPGRPDLAFTITGQSDFLPAADPAATDDELRRLLVGGPKFYSAANDVQAFFCSRPLLRIDLDAMRALGNTLANAFAGALRDRLSCVDLYGRPLYRCVVVWRDPFSTYTVVGSLRLSLSPVGVPVIDDLRVDKRTTTDPRIALIFGEEKYFQEKVWRGPGRILLGAQDLQLWSQAQRVGDLDVNAAARLARDWIRTASQLSLSIPSPSGIGGTIRTIFLDGHGPARTLK